MMNHKSFTAAEYEALTNALPTIHAGSPLKTNASCNRDMAIREAKKGKNAEQICAKWPEVFCLVDGKLGQLYDYKLADGSGRMETNRRILGGMRKQK